jgi:hypothetical protein
MSIVEKTGDIISNTKNHNKLINTRIIRKELVYIIGLSYDLSFNRVNYFYFFFKKNILFMLIYVY